MLVACGVAVLLVGCAGEVTETTPVADEGTAADDGDPEEADGSVADEASSDGGGGVAVRAGLEACDLLTADTLEQLFGLQFEEGQGIGPNLCNFQAADGGDHGVVVIQNTGAIVDQARRRFESGATIEREVDLGDLSYVETVPGENRIAVLVIGDTGIEVALNGLQQPDPAAVDDLLESVLEAATE